jgi:hypothetical protein
VWKCRNQPAIMRAARITNWRGVLRQATTQFFLLPARCTRRPRRRGHYQARFCLDGVEMPSSGRPSASPGSSCLLRSPRQMDRLIMHFLSRSQVPRKRLPVENACSGASLRWADEASAPTQSTLSRESGSCPAC